jgi:hypothetical protein
VTLNVYAVFDVKPVIGHEPAVIVPTVPPPETFRELIVPDGSVQVKVVEVSPALAERLVGADGSVVNANEPLADLNKLVLLYAER